MTQARRPSGRPGPRGPPVQSAAEEWGRGAKPGPAPTHHHSLGENTAAGRIQDLT